jgi:hypothetical protein
MLSRWSGEDEDDGVALMLAVPAACAKSTASLARVLGRRAIER